ncbi:unnamed protein product [Diatraea saccharalis]|uniref:HIRA-interacting protein 3-like n=1 Tax=Diatraea saccharalis TaxID=40085 RepID=A0A9P0G268_9NEOP|nr:unnamed protein product [Diatraea saccharalis]
MNYEAERAMNQKRLRMEGEPGHGVVQGNGLPLNYIDNGHQIPYQPYAGAYNTHYPPPDAFAAYGPPPPGGYAPQNLSYAPPAHQNYPHHQSFPPQQPPQAQLHMQSHMGKLFQGYGDVGVHKPAWPPQPHLLPPIDTQKPLDVKQLKPEIKLEPTDSQKRPHPENEMMGGDLDQPKIKIKTDIFKPDDLAPRPVVEKPLAQGLPKVPSKLGVPEANHVVEVKRIPLEKIRAIIDDWPNHLRASYWNPVIKNFSWLSDYHNTAAIQNRDSVSVVCDGIWGKSVEVDTSLEEKTEHCSNNVAQKPLEPHKPPELQNRDDLQVSGENKPSDKSAESCKVDGVNEGVVDNQRPAEACAVLDKSEEERKPFSSPEVNKSVATPGKTPTSSLEPKKRGRPKGSTNKPKPPGTPTGAPRAPGPRPAAPRPAPPAPRPRHAPYQYAVRPFRKDFSGIQFRRRWSDECLDSSHIPNEVYFGDVPVSTEVLFNYYDANAERERLATQAAQIAAQKAAAAKLAAAKLQARGIISNEVTTVDSSSSEESSGSSGSDSEESDDETPLKRGPGRPKGSKNSTSPKRPPAGTPGRRGRPPVPPELRQPGITDMKKFCKAAGIRFDYKKLVEGCTKNKERVQKMMDLLTAAGLEGKPTLEKCKALKQAKMDKKEQEKQAKKEAKAKHKDKEGEDEEGAEGPPSSRRMTRGATGVKPRQRIVISSDEEDDTPAARRTLSKLRSSVNSDSDSD